jgi:hypothetical protein
VSCRTEALFFAAIPPEPLLPRKFGQALAVESSATATAYEDSFSATFSARASTKFSEVR